MKLIIIVIVNMCLCKCDGLLIRARGFEGLGIAELDTHSLNKTNLPRRWKSTVKAGDTLRYRGDIELTIQGSGKHEKISEIYKIGKVVKIFIKNLDVSEDIVFRELPKIKVIGISKTGFKTVKNRTFTFITVKELYLTENDINDIDDQAFREDLLILNLRCNQLEQIRPQWFQNVSTLKELQIEANKLTVIPENLFKNFSSLTKISLNLNRIHTIAPGAFSGRSSFAWISLGYNSLKVLPSAVFQSGNITTTSLELQFNNLTFLSKDLVSKIRVTGTTNIDGNPWKCSCYMEHIVPWITWELYGAQDEGWPQDRQGEPRCVVPKESICTASIDEEVIEYFQEHSSPPKIDTKKFCNCLDEDEYYNCLYG